MTDLFTKGDVPIAYRVDGPVDGEPILMINGLGMQLIQWPQEFLDGLHAAGFKTIRVDNRDIGKSGRIEGGKVPNPYVQLLLTTFGLSTSAPYRLEDMARDALSVLDELGIAKAHVLGLSMGGIISQVLAGSYPDRVDRLTLFMTTTGNRSLPRPKGEAAKILFAREAPATSREEAIDRMVNKWLFFTTRDGGWDEDQLRNFHAPAIDRGMDLQGWQRQLAAIIESGDIRTKSRDIKAPTLIIHGAADPLVPLEAGKDVHANVPGARMEIIQGMGHDLPPIHRARLSALVAEHLKAT